MPEYLKMHEYDTTVSAQLISAIGIAQTIGMIGLGYLGDRSWMNVNVCYSGCMLSKLQPLSIPSKKNKFHTNNNFFLFSNFNCSLWPFCSTDAIAGLQL